MKSKMKLLWGLCRISNQLFVEMITNVRVYPVGMLLINKDSYSNIQADQVDLASN